MTEHRRCPDCGGAYPVPGPPCQCGCALPLEEASGRNLPEGGRSEPKRWMAAIPGLIVLALATGAVIHSSSQFARVSRVVTPGGRATENTGQGSSAARRDCVETYGVTLKTSEYYVPEGSFGAPPRARDAPRELSTVVQGMARNGCGAPLKDVRILIRVRDDEGRRGSSWARVGPLAAGETGPFERAWMGRVTSYDIVEIR